MATFPNGLDCLGAIRHSGTAPEPAVMLPAAPVAVELIFTGTNLGQAYLDFVADRARRFSLDGHAHAEGGRFVHVVLRGPEALVDMLEVACLLGPVECLVEAVEARPAPAVDLASGFALHDAA